MERFTEEFKMEVVRYYYGQSERSIEKTLEHFHIDKADIPCFTDWKLWYAREAVRYHFEHHCSLAKSSEMFGVDHSQMYFWAKKYGKEFEFNAEKEIKKLREELDDTRAELAALKAWVRTNVVNSSL